MRPEDVGLSHSNLVLGKHSGRHAFRDRVSKLGFELDEFEINRAFQEFKKLADKKKDVYDGDIEAIIMNVDNSSAGPWVMKSLEVQTSTNSPAQATVVLQEENGDKKSITAQGDGPIAAAFQALEQVTGVVLTLKNFELHSASIGEDAQGEVTVTVEHDGDSYRGNGTSVDIVEAGCRACLEVMNRILRRRHKTGVEVDDVGRATI
jgi:2-isopropylmalate synthase